MKRTGLVGFLCVFLFGSSVALAAGPLWDLSGRIVGRGLVTSDRHTFHFDTDTSDYWSWTWVPATFGGDPANDKPMTEWWARIDIPSSSEEVQNDPDTYLGSDSDIALAIRLAWIKGVSTMTSEPMFGLPCHVIRAGDSILVHSYGYIDLNNFVGAEIYTWYVVIGDWFLVDADSLATDAWIKILPGWGRSWAVVWMCDLPAFQFASDDIRESVRDLEDPVDHNANPPAFNDPTIDGLIPDPLNPHYDFPLHLWGPPNTGNLGGDINPGENLSPSEMRNWWKQIEQEKLRRAEQGALPSSLFPSALFPDDSFDDWFASVADNPSTIIYWSVIDDDDEICNLIAGENGGVSPNDCGYMMITDDSVCDEYNGETSQNSDDCTGNGGHPTALDSRPTTAVNGDGICQRNLGENANNCVDCVGTEADAICDLNEGETGVVNSAGYDPACDGLYYGDEVCSPEANENIWNAPDDCLVEGVWEPGDPSNVNGVCEWWLGETPQNSPSDCSQIITGGTYGNGVCDPGEDTFCCPQDCRDPTNSIAMKIAFVSPTVYASSQTSAFYTHGTSHDIVASCSDGADGNGITALDWTSSIQSGVLETGGTFNTSSLNSGVHALRASYTNSDGFTGYAQVMIEIDAVPTVEITANASYSKGASGNITATATSQPRGNIASTIVWTSNIQSGTLATGANLSIATLNIGTHTLTATATNQAEGTNYDTAVVEIHEDYPVLTITTWDQPVVTGTTVDMAATATDVQDGDLGDNIQWRDYVDDTLYATGHDVSFNVSSLRVQMSGGNPGINQLVCKVTDSYSQTTTLGPYYVTIVGSTPGALTALNYGGEFQFVNDNPPYISLEWSSSWTTGGTPPVFSQAEKYDEVSEEWIPIGNLTNATPAYWEDTEIELYSGYYYRFRFEDSAWPTPGVVYGPESDEISTSPE